MTAALTARTRALTDDIGRGTLASPSQGGSMTVTETETHEAVAEAAEAVTEALRELLDAINADDALYDALRGGGAPYALRNMLPDLEGREGGWLQAEGDSFSEQVETLGEFARDLALVNLDEEEEA